MYKYFSFYLKFLKLYKNKPILKKKNYYKMASFYGKWLTFCGCTHKTNPRTLFVFL